MNSRFESGFAKHLRGIPDQVARRATKVLDLLEQNNRHPSLHFKRVKAGKDAWSIRVTKDYRMVGYRSGDAVTWFWIGTHNEYDKLLKRLGR